MSSSITPTYFTAASILIVKEHVERNYILLHATGKIITFPNHADIPYYADTTHSLVPTFEGSREPHTLDEPHQATLTPPRIKCFDIAEMLHAPCSWNWEATTWVTAIYNNQAA